MQPARFQCSKSTPLPARPQLGSRPPSAELAAKAPQPSSPSKADLTELDVPQSAVIHSHACILHSSRSALGHTIAGPYQCGQRRGCLAVQARERSGPSGIHIEGNSPTSPKGWEIMRQKLTDAGVKVLSPQEVIFARDKGTMIVDVRPEGDYDEGHVPGAANVPFYRPISGWSPFKVARRVGYAMFGVLKGTEVNPDFAADVRELLSDADKAVILYCSQGGVLECNETYKRGWQTRSLVAAYDLLQEGLINVSIMKGGYTEWANSGRDIEIMVEEEEGETVETAEQAETAKVQRN